VEYSRCAKKSPSNNIQTHRQTEAHTYIHGNIIVNLLEINGREKNLEQTKSKPNMINHFLKKSVRIQLYYLGHSVCGEGGAGVVGGGKVKEGD
jgi:hypothetical protein